MSLNRDALLPFSYDDGGRAAAKRKGANNDCFVRALCIATDLPYDEVFPVVAKANQAAGGKRGLSSGTTSAVTNNLLKAYGFIKVERCSKKRPTYTQVAHAYRNALVTTNGHIAAIKNGELRDKFDGRTYKMPHETFPRERKARSVWVRVGRVKPGEGTK